MASPLHMKYKKIQLMIFKTLTDVILTLPKPPKPFCRFRNFINPLVKFCENHSVNVTGSLKRRHFLNKRPMLSVNELNQDFWQPCQSTKFYFGSLKNVT